MDEEFILSGYKKSAETRDENQQIFARYRNKLAKCIISYSWVKTCQADLQNVGKFISSIRPRGDFQITTSPPSPSTRKLSFFSTKFLSFYFKKWGLVQDVRLFAVKNILLICDSVRPKLGLIGLKSDILIYLDEFECFLSLYSDILIEFSASISHFFLRESLTIKTLTQILNQ